MRYNSLFKRMSLLMLVLLYAVSGVLAQATKPPVVEFTKALTDTVYSVGPYVFEAKVASRSGFAIKRPWLHYTATLNKVTTHDSIYMTSLGSDSMWTATIPRHVYGTSFVYWIRGYDTLGNNAIDSGAFVSQFNASGTVILNGDSVLYGGTSTGIQNCSFPFMLAGASPSWVRVLYMSNHVRPNKNGGCIGAMGFYTTYNAVNTHNNVKIYLKATTMTSLTAITSSTIDPIKDGATLVYQGTITGKTGWNQYKFDRGFVLPAGMNLLWYVVDDDVNNPCNSTILYWMRNSGVGYNAVDRQGQFSCSGNSSGTVTDLPTTMFYFGRMNSGNPDTNSVAMESIDNPTEGTIAGKQPVKVTIINKGVGNLTYAKVGWSVNGVAQTPFTYKGNLPCDFTDTITLGSYTQKLMGYDTITVWVSDPNNKVDSVLEDDTLTVIAFGCDSLLKGTYTVGKGGKYNFPSLADALKILETCGWGGDVTLKIATGTYAENLIFKDFQAPNGYRLTITSIAGVADSVVFKPTSGVVADFASTSGLTFKYIKLDATNIANYCVQMGSGLKDIEFYHCILQGYKSTTTGNSHSVIYKASGAAVSDIRFIGNQILNGNYGIYFYGGGTTSKNSRIVFDSNYIAGYYYYAAYFYYNKMRFTHNTIEELSNIYSSYDYGMYCYYLDSSLIDANRFITHNHASYQYSLRTYYTDSATWITNNEIIMENNNTTSYGLYIYYTYGTKVINNSVLQYGNATSYGMYVYTGSTTYYGEIKNNLVTCLGNGTCYPLYATSTTAASNFDFDYNCWWSPSNVGYVGSAISTLAALQNALPSAKHDIFQRPVFRDTTKSLALRLAIGMDCPKIAGVERDFKGDVRVALTTRGAHAMKPVPCNGTLISFLNVPSKTDAGDTIRPSVVLSNSGTDTITEATIRVELNGVVTGRDIQWKGKIGLGQSDNISLGSFILKGGDNVFTAYIVKLGSMKDTINDDDTVSISTHTCVQSYAGSYTVGGSNPDFKSLDDALLALTSCGVTGPVTLRLRSGQYGAVSIYGPILGASSNNTITLMPDTNAKVVIDGGAGTAFNIQNSGHWHFRNITFGNTKDGRIGVELLGSITDVSFRHCNIYASTTTTSSDYKAVNYPNSSGASYYPVDLEFVGNHIQGGYYNMYLYYLAGGTGNMTASSITVDSNVLTDAYYYGIYSYYYSHYKSLSYNTVTNRKNCSNAYYGIYQYYYSNVDRVEGNRVHINNESTAYGIYWYYYKNYASYGGTPGVFKNNEVILLGTTGAKYGIYFYMPYQNWEILHNSVYAQTGSSTVYGIYLYNSSTSYMETFKNNLIVTKGTSTNYPLYLSSYYTSSYVILDYNNYYNQSGSYIGYAGSAISSFSNWQTTTGQEVNSLNISPSFKDTTVSLELNDYEPFVCPRIASDTTDINGNRRTLYTTMGCYGLHIKEDVDLQAMEFLSPQPITDVTCFPASMPVQISLKNIGLKTADFSRSNLKISLDVTGAISYHSDTTFTTGKMAFQQTDTFLLGTIPTLITGVYRIKITLNDTSDIYLENDTMSLIYKVGRVELPYDIDFSTEPNEFINVTMSGKTAWKVIKGSGSSPALNPAFGTGQLEFAGAKDPGAYAHAVFNGVNIQGCVNPTLSFWFAHNADCEGLPDVLTVLISTDGGINYTEVKRILVGDTVTAWKQYDIDLSAFTQSNCLSMVFRAMSFGNTNQCIDRIRITASQDAALSLLPIDISNRTACDNTPVDVKAVITNLSRLNIDMLNDTLTLNVTGAVSYSNKVVYNHRLSSFEVDTITLGQISLDANGAYYLEAYMQSFDDRKENDTITDSTLFVMQDIVLDTVFGLDGQMFKLTGETVNVSGMAVNNGNIAVEQVIFHMSIDGSEVLADTVHQLLYPGDTLIHPMSQAFTVPAVSKDQPFYFFELKTELSCDADNTNDVINIVGQVNIPDSIDLQVLEITTTERALGNTKLSPSVRVANIGNLEADNIVVHVEVINDSNRVVENISEMISHMAVNETKMHDFTMTYKVPNYTGKYTLRAYVEAFDGDSIRSNDTLARQFRCYRDSVGIREATGLDWSLGQNIPNPASEVTAIPFTLPQEGQVRLSVMTANGQVILKQEIQGEAGGNRLELNTGDWASGLYYYTMEYRGQRITRKMTVTR